MAYTPNTWEDAPSTASPLSAARLNDMDAYWEARSVGVYVEAHGAVGDGVTDDTTAIQAAIDAAIADGGNEVIFGPGRFLHTGLDIHTLVGITLRGVGGGDGDQASNPGTKLDGPIDASQTRWLKLADLYIEGTLSFTGGQPNPQYIKMERVLFRNPDPYDLNLNINVTTVDDVVMALHAEDCLFDQGGIFINVINTSMFVRCRVANSRKDAAVDIAQDATFVDSENHLVFDTCTIEGNKKGGIRAGRNTGRLTVRDSYLEGNNQDNLGYGDIDITSLDTVNDGGLVLDGNEHVGTTSDFHVRFPASPSRSPRLLMQMCRFNGQPANGGAVVLNPPLGLISIGNYSSTTLYSGGAGPSVRVADGGTGAGDSGSTTRNTVEVEGKELGLYTDVWLPASAFIATFGSPTSSQRNNIWPTWLHPDGSQTVVGSSVRLPDGWKTFAIDAFWSNASASSGNFRVQMAHQMEPEGGSLLTSPVFSTVLVVADGSTDVVQVTEFFTGVAVSGDVMAVRFDRFGGHADDTSTGSLRFVGARLRRLT